MDNVVVLVLVWNGQRYLQECMGALLAQDFSGAYRVLAVDNASTDGSADFLRAQFPQVALLRNSANLGFAGGNNAGLRMLLAGAAPRPIDRIPDIVVLLNQDTEVASDWLRRLVETFDRHENAAIVGCKIFFPDRKMLQHAGGDILWPLATGRHRGTGEADTGQYEIEEPVEFVTGAAMAIRTQVFDRIGLLDEGFTPAYYEDADLCYRARAAGFEVIYTPAARLIHHEAASLQGQSAAHQRAYHRNRVRFALKYCRADQIVDDFVPAELEEIKRWSIADSLARKHAYVDGILSLPALSQRYGEEGSGLATYIQLSRALRLLHQTIVEEERKRRAESGYRLPQKANSEPRLASGADAHGDASERASAPQSEETPMTTQDPAVEPALDEEPVDVAAIMRQIRRKISERQQGRGADIEIAQALDAANQQWNTVYEQLRLAPARSTLGRAWDALRVRLHHEVRSYLDPMIFRQTEFNSSVVRALNGLFQRSQATVGQAEFEALRDELIQLREQVRRLERRPQDD